MKTNYYRMLQGVITPLNEKEAKIIIDAYTMLSRRALVHTAKYQKDGEEHIILILPSEYKPMLKA